MGPIHATSWLTAGKRSTGSVANYRKQKSPISWVRFLEACFGFCSGVLVAGMSNYRHNRQTGSAWISPMGCPAQYHRVLFDAAGDAGRQDVCVDSDPRDAIAFGGRGTDQAQGPVRGPAVPSERPTTMGKLLPSLTARASLQRGP